MRDIVVISQECSAEFCDQRICDQLRSGYWDREIFSYAPLLLGTLDFLLSEAYCVLVGSSPG